MKIIELYHVSIIHYFLDFEVLNLRMSERRGEKRGKELHGRLVAQNLIENTDFGDEKIANLAAVTPEVVKKVRAGR